MDDASERLPAVCPGSTEPVAALPLDEALKSAARDLGFEPVGVCPAVAPANLARFVEWLSAGYAGEMHYLPDRATVCHIGLKTQRPPTFLSDERYGFVQLFGGSGEDGDSHTCFSQRLGNGAADASPAASDQSNLSCQLVVMGRSVHSEFTSCNRCG